MSHVPARWLSQREQVAWRAYISGTTLLLDTLDRELKHSHGISLAEYEVLVHLSEHPDATMRMSALADATRFSRSRMTHTISRMERAGWVKRRGSANDGRGVEASLTTAGRQKLESAAPVHADGVRRHLVDPAPATDLDALGRVMSGVVDRLCELPQPRDP